MAILAIKPASAQAYSCPNKPVELRYEEAYRIFLIHVTRVTLDDSLHDLFFSDRADDDEFRESIKPVLADYEILEDFKGDVSFKPKLIDFFGIGTGFAGLYPGQYYLVMLENHGDDRFPGYHVANICNTPFRHHRLNVDSFQEQLNAMRALRDKEH
ncbi:MAG: hypothetical protein AAGE61_06475 [Pseudomonadota bacterium]